MKSNLKKFKELPNKWLYFPVLILVIHFIIRLIDQSQMIWMFPLDQINDWASYLAQLHFLKVCGFHNLCSYWYHQVFVTFSTMPPGWYFFTLPLYLIFNNVQLAAYISLILLYLISFLGIYYILKNEKLSKFKSIALFLFFFGNAIAIGNFIRLGRIVSIFAFTTFILIFLILNYYKDKKLNKNFWWFIPLYAISLISHPQETVLIHFPILGFFLIKNNKEKLKIILAMVGGILLSSFWLVPFLKSFSRTVSSIHEGNTLWLFTKSELFTNIAVFVIPLIFIFVFLFYYKSTNKNKKELLFYSPLLIMAIMLFFRITPLIPIMRNISADPFLLMFIFFIGFLLFKTNFRIYSINIKKLILVGILILPLLSILINVAITPFFVKHGPLEEATINLIPKIEGNFLIIDAESDTSFSGAYDSFIPIYYNKNSSSGWYPYYPYIEDQEGISAGDVRRDVEKGDCEEIRSKTTSLNIGSIITYDDQCDMLKTCNFRESFFERNVCLFLL